MGREGGRGSGKGRPEDPILQLERSHHRLGEVCDSLTAAVRDRNLGVISEACAFFARQGRRHEQDEELSLFPRLEGSVARDVIERLRREHRAHEALHERLERAISGSSWPDLEALASEISGAYREHIELEERTIFPLARRTLEKPALEEMLAEMAARRDR
jgi:hemerythrin-like domain-containing protein